MADLGNAFRQFGQDISSAMLSPVEARMKALEFNRQMDEQRYKLSEREREKAERDEKRANKKAAADSIRKEFGDAAADAYLTDSLGDIAKLREANRPAAAREPNPTERYKQIFGALDFVDRNMSNLQGQLAAKIADSEGKDPSALTKDMENFNAVSSALETEVLPQMAALGSIIDKNSYANDLTTRVSKKLSGISPSELQFVQKATFESLGKKLKMSQSNIDEINSLSAKYNAGKPFSGIPSAAEIKAGLLSAWVSKYITQAEVEMLSGSPDESFEEFTGRLSKMLTKESKAPPVMKALAANILANAEANRVLGLSTPDPSWSGRQDVSDPRLNVLRSRLSDKELMEMAANGKTSELRKFAKSELRLRSSISEVEDTKKESPEQRAATAKRLSTTRRSQIF